MSVIDHESSSLHKAYDTSLALFTWYNSTPFTCSKRQVFGIPLRVTRWLYLCLRGGACVEGALGAPLHGTNLTLHNMG